MTAGSLRSRSQAYSSTRRSPWSSWTTGRCSATGGVGEGWVVVTDGLVCQTREGGAAAVLGGRLGIVQPRGQQRALRRVGGEGQGNAVGGAGLLGAPQGAQELGAGGVEEVVAVERRAQRVDLIQRLRRAVDMRRGDGPVGPHHRRRRDAQEGVVEGDDLRPVGVLPVRRL